MADVSICPSSSGHFAGVAGNEHSAESVEIDILAAISETIVVAVVFVWNGCIARYTYTITIVVVDSYII